MGFPIHKELGGLIPIDVILPTLSEHDANSFLALEQKELLPLFSSSPPMQARKVNCKIRAIINNKHNNSLMVYTVYTL